MIADLILNSQHHHWIILNVPVLTVCVYNRILAVSVWVPGWMGDVQTIVLPVWSRSRHALHRGWGNYACAWQIHTYMLLIRFTRWLKQFYSLNHLWILERNCAYLVTFLCNQLWLSNVDNMSFSSQHKEYWRGLASHPLLSPVDPSKSFILMHLPYFC